MLNNQERAAGLKSPPHIWHQSETLPLMTDRQWNPHAFICKSHIFERGPLWVRTYVRIILSNLYTTIAWYELCTVSVRTRMHVCSIGTALYLVSSIKTEKGLHITATSSTFLSPLLASIVSGNRFS